MACVTCLTFLSDYIPILPFVQSGRLKIFYSLGVYGRKCIILKDLEVLF